MMIQMYKLYIYIYIITSILYKYLIHNKIKIQVLIFYFLQEFFFKNSLKGAIK